MNLKTKWMAGVFLPAIVLASCGGDDLPTASNPPPAAFDGIKRNNIALLSEAEIKADLADFRRTSSVSDADGKAALAYFEDHAAWESVSGSNGNYTFTNLEIEGATIETVEVSGLQKLGEELMHADYISMENIRNDDGLRIDRVELAMPDVSWMAPAVALAADQSEKEPVTYGDLDPFDMPTEVTAENRAMLAMWRSFEGAGYIEGARFSPDDDVSFALDFVGMTMSDQAYSVRISRAKMTNEYSYGDEPEHVSAEALSIRNYKLSNAEVKQGGFMFPMTYILGAYVNTLNPHNRNFDAMSARNVFVQYEDNIMSAQIDSMDYWYEDGPGDAHYMNVNAPSIVYEFGADFEGDAFAMSALELNPLVLSYGGRALVDPGKDMISLEAGGLHVKDGFDLDLTYKVEGMNQVMGALSNPAMFGLPVKGEQESIEDMMNKIAIRGATIDITDRGLHKRGLNFAAASGDMSVDDAKAFAKNAITASTMVAGSEYQAELAQAYIDAMNAFIDNGGTLRMKMTPDGDAPTTELAFPFNALMPSDPFSARQDRSKTTEIIDGWLKKMNITFEHVD